MCLTSDALRTVLAALLSAAAWPFLQLIQQFTSIKTSFTAFLIITQWLGTVPFHKRFIFHVYAVDVQITEKWRFCCIVYFDIPTFRMLECYWSVYTWVVPEMCPTSQPIVVSCRDCLRCQTHHISSPNFFGCLLESILTAEAPEYAPKQVSIICIKHFEKILQNITVNSFPTNMSRYG